METATTTNEKTIPTINLGERYAPSHELVEDVAKELARQRAREARSAEAISAVHDAEAIEREMRERVSILEGSLQLNRRDAQAQLETVMAHLRDAEDFVRRGEKPREDPEVLRGEAERVRERVQAFDTKIRAVEDDVDHEFRELKERANTCKDSLEAARLLRMQRNDVRAAQHELAEIRLREASRAAGSARAKYSALNHGDGLEVPRVVAKHVAEDIAEELEQLAPNLVPLLGMLAELSAMTDSNVSAGAIKHLGGRRFEIDFSSRQLPSVPADWLPNIIARAESALEEGTNA